MPRATGLTGHRVERTDQLLSALKTALDGEGVHLIDLPVDYSQNDLILNRQIREESKAL